MFTRAHHKHQAKHADHSRERGQSAAPVSASPEVALPSEPAFSADITVDEALLALDAELSSLSQLQVAQAAKERGWATLRRELDRRPVRVSSPALLRGTGAKATLSGPARPVLAGHSRSWRVALGSAAAAVAIVAALLGTYAAGLLGGDNGGPSPFASVTTSATAPESTSPSEETTVSTQAPDSTTPTTGSTGTTTGTTQATTPSTGGSTPTSPPTTKPAQTTTTNEEQMAAAQRVKTAEAAALELGDAVVLYFLGSGDLSGVRALVASSAQASLTQLISSLSEPYGSYLVASTSLSSTSVRVTVAFNDRTPDGSGVLTERVKTFRLTVRVEAGSATITAITAGS